MQNDEEFTKLLGIMIIGNGNVLPKIRQSLLPKKVMGPYHNSVALSCLLSIVMALVVGGDLAPSLLSGVAYGYIYVPFVVPGRV